MWWTQKKRKNRKKFSKRGNGKYCLTVEGGGRQRGREKTGKMYTKRTEKATREGIEWAKRVQKEKA